jgi:hypothetical protein
MSTFSDHKAYFGVMRMPNGQTYTSPGLTESLPLPSQTLIKHPCSSRTIRIDRVRRQGNIQTHTVHQRSATAGILFLLLTLTEVLHTLLRLVSAALQHTIPAKGSIRGRPGVGVGMPVGYGRGDGVEIVDGNCAAFPSRSVRIVVFVDFTPSTGVEEHNVCYFGGLRFRSLGQLSFSTMSSQSPSLPLSLSISLPFRAELGLHLSGKELCAQ